MKKLDLSLIGGMPVLSFKYWLQGAFELAHLGVYEDISAKQVAMIRNHAKLVKEKDEFMTFLDGILTSAESAKVKSINVSLANEIKKRLEAEFKKISDESNPPKRVSDKIICSATNTGLKKDSKSIKYC